MLTIEYENSDITYVYAVTVSMLIFNKKEKILYIIISPRDNTYIIIPINEIIF